MEVNDNDKYEFFRELFKRYSAKDLMTWRERHFPHLAEMLEAVSRLNTDAASTVRQDMPDSQIVVEIEAKELFGMPTHTFLTFDSKWRTSTGCESLSPSRPGRPPADPMRDVSGTAPQRFELAA